jgi:hypothetical protein
MIGTDFYVNEVGSGTIIRIDLAEKFRIRHIQICNTEHTYGTYQLAYIVLLSSVAVPCKISRSSSCNECHPDPQPWSFHQRAN